MSEAKIERKFIKLLRESGVTFQCVKFEPPGQVGWPDRLILLPGGTAIFVEFKQPGQTPTRIQRFRICQLLSLGFHALWATSAEDAVNEVLRCQE